MGSLQIKAVATDLKKGLLQSKARPHLFEIRRLKGSKN